MLLPVVVEVVVAGVVRDDCGTVDQQDQTKLTDTVDAAPACCIRTGRLERHAMVHRMRQETDCVSCDRSGVACSAVLDGGQASCHCHQPDADRSVQDQHVLPIVA